MSMTKRFRQARRVACSERKGPAERALLGVPAKECGVKISHGNLLHSLFEYLSKSLYDVALLARTVIGFFSTVKTLAIACARRLSRMRRGARAWLGERWLRQHLAILEDGAHAYA